MAIQINENLNLAKPGAFGMALTTSSSEFDPDSGWQYVDTYEGTEESCDALTGKFAAQGVRCRKYQVEGPVWRVDVRVGKANTRAQSEEPTENWEFDKDFIQVDMRNHPAIIELAGGSAATLNLWIQQIDDLIRRGSDVTEPVADGYREIYALRSFGQKAFEVERLVLKRDRTYSTQFLNTETLDALPFIYTTSALISTFGIPPAISRRFPATPTFTPAYHVWAWKKRRAHTSIIPKLSKVQETTDFVFSAWATRTYTLVT